MDDFVKYRVKIMEGFKDGNILGGRFLKPEEIIVLTDADIVKIRNSGGTLDILETLVPNPKKELPEIIEMKEEQAIAEAEEEESLEAEIAQAEEKLYRAEVDEKPAPRRRGRPRKNAS